jgi:hypothetical protein
MPQITRLNLNNTPSGGHLEASGLTDALASLRKLSLNASASLRCEVFPSCLGFAKCVLCAAMPYVPAGARG